MSRVRVLLPLVQLIIAVALTTSNFVRADSPSNPAWRAPDRQVCDAVNAPAAVVRFGLLKALDRWAPNHVRADFVIETGVYFVLVALLWYGVSVEITRHRQSRCNLARTRTVSRALFDIFFVLFGIAVGTAGQPVRHQFMDVTAYSTFLALPYFIWAVVLVVFYGYDFCNSLFSRT